jgi:hypothetical protein
VLGNSVSGVRAMSYEYFTSYAVVFFPSCQKTSFRRWNVSSVVSAFTSHERASQGMASNFSL